MPARIAALCRVCSRAAGHPGELFVDPGLARLQIPAVLERLERVTATSIERIHVVGGGARNQLLCRLTAELCGASCCGTDEATALGNVLIQARAGGALGGRWRSFARWRRRGSRGHYEPSDAEHASDLRALPRRDRPARADIRAGGSRP